MPAATVLHRVLERYALYGEIASGGMASVHYGRFAGPAGFSRTVAIKQLHPHLARDPEFVSMFLQEARLAARVRHPNVVSTLDVVSLGGEVFLVMEFVLGETLAGLLHNLQDRGGRVDPAVASAVMVGALHGLHAAHEATGDQGAALGIVHRDVSPQNIMVTLDGSVRVLDFGVAKASQARDDQTREGVLKGKLGYLAPEQIEGGLIDRRVDVYAASVVLWELLAGQRLFGGATSESKLHAVLHKDVPLPSQIVDGISKELDAVVMRGLCRDAQSRFATAREMALQLERVQPPASPTVLSQWVGQTAGEPLRERERIVAAIEALPVPSADVVDDTARAIPLTRASPHAASHRALRRWGLPVAVGIVSLVAAVALWRARTAGPAGPVAASAPVPPSASALAPCTPTALSNIIAISSGPASHHVCALSQDRTVWCWGDNHAGQLGFGDVEAHARPVKVAKLERAAAVSAGNIHTCAALDDGRVACWGKDVLRRPSFVLGLSEVAAVSAGGRHACVLHRSGRVECWGDNDAGQLGSSSVQDALTVTVPGIEASAIATGTAHSCAVARKDGSVWCWGANTHGQLGLGTTDTNPHDRPARVERLPPISGVAAGDQTTFAWTADGALHGWGFSLKRAVRVPLDRVASVAAGARLTCALRADGTVWCWGFNEQGQLGSTSADDTTTPTQVEGLSGAKAVAAGDAHACALLASGQVLCWGNNTHGELGAPPDQERHPRAAAVMACRNW
jgi:eukaryotic-like serine/threonine-protein kinase